jgi:hypothetical protein
MTDESGHLVDAWIKLHEVTKTYGNDSEAVKHLFWAFEELDNICGENPERALKQITNILGSTQDEYILANLAAGPLETLLARHGKKLIVDVERLAKNDHRFRSLLQNVWQNRIDDQTWGRILKATKA